MKKYIFPVFVLAIVIVMAMTITKFTQQGSKTEKPVKIIEGQTHITFDNAGNSYYIKPDSITVDKQDETEVRFHASYLKIYSDKGRETLDSLYTQNGVDSTKMADVDHEIENIHFGYINGDKFVTGAECIFYKADDTEIPELKIEVSVNETTMQPIPSKSIGEILFDYAYSRLPKD